MRTPIAAFLVLALTVSACSDSTGPEGDRLDRAEALQLAAQVLASSEGAAAASMSTSVADVPEGAAAPTEFTIEHESTHPCPSAGQVAVDFVLNGSFDEETKALQAELAGSQVHTGCAFPHDGATLTVSGEPSVAFAASVGAVDGVPSQPFTFSLDGVLRWGSSDGRSGLCELSLAAVTDFAAQQRTVQGAICGHTIDQTLSWN